MSATARVFVAASSDAASGADGDGDLRREWETAKEGERDGEMEEWKEGEVDAWLTSSQPRTQPWIAAYIDLINAGQTQLWLFASWESDPLVPLPSSAPDSLASLSIIASQPDNKIHVSLIKSLFQYISTSLIPELPTTPPEEWLLLERTGKYLSTPYKREKVLMGTVGEKVWGLLPREGRTRTDDGYWKVGFQVPVSTPGSGSGDVGVISGQEGKGEEGVENGIPKTNPGGRGTWETAPDIPLRPEFHFAALKDEHLQAVVDRTPVPRTLATLRSSISLGIFHPWWQDRPVGWCFLGKDASLNSLHTEEEFRGQGLAAALGAEILRRRGVGVGEGGDGVPTKGEREGPEARFTWAHADVSKHNKASLRVMEKLGGRKMWMVMWTEVDVGDMLDLLGCVGSVDVKTRMLGFLERGNQGAPGRQEG